MARKRTDIKRPIESYEHRDKERLNNPPAGLVTPETDPDAGQKKRRYAYDPHLDPQLVWAGKAEHTSFEVPTVSLHVHERIDPKTIIEAVRRSPSPHAGRVGVGYQLPLFEQEREEPLREAIEFYRHKHGWSNRLIAGDSLLVMNSLLEKEGLAGKVQMIYIDPPYGIKYGSNFQPFVNKRDVKDGKDEDLTAEPEQIKAFRDTWELGIHSYLTYLRDRLLLARELLTESGSIFVQISDENVHRVRCLMDEVFGVENFVSLISFSTTSGFQASTLSRAGDYLCWYTKDKRKIKYHQLFREKQLSVEGMAGYDYVQLFDGTERNLTSNEKQEPSLIPKGSRIFAKSDLQSQGAASEEQAFQYQGRTFRPNLNAHWKPNFPEGLRRLCVSGRVTITGNTIRYKRYNTDFPLFPITNLWAEQLSEQTKRFVVQTSEKIIERCLLMTTDPGDLVFDPTCVRKGTRVWRVGSPPVIPPQAGSPPVVPPQAGGRETPSPLAGRAGEGLSPSPFTGRAGEGLSPSPAEEGLSLVPIETLRPGDWVLAHDGLPHRIRRVIRRLYKGQMIGIRCEDGGSTLWLTADHRILAHRRPHTLGGNADWSGIPVSMRRRSKELRRAMTPPERKLWSALRADSTGLAFRRQHPIGPYIADFYSREAALVVEVDGALAHSSPEAMEHDRVRDEYMRALNLKVLRFSASEVERNLEGVYDQIQAACRQQHAPEHAEWIEAGAIAKGDIVFHGPERRPVRVAEVETSYSEEEVYDLEVEDAHSFITEICVVHNCGSGTTAYVAEQWGRRWITCDTSRVALAIARQRLMTAVFDYYELAHPEEGVGSGFKYKTVPHVTLKSIANNPEIDGIYARMHPAIEQALAELNAALKGQKVKFKVTTGGREGQFVDFAAPDEATFTMPSGQVVKVNELVEWEVPFSFELLVSSLEWEGRSPEENARLREDLLKTENSKLKTAFEAFHSARRAMQKKMDEAIARHAEQETLYDQPFVDRKKVRVSGPFTVEAVPAPVVKSPEEILHPSLPVYGEGRGGAEVARSGETLRQAEWRDELLKTGVRGKAGQYIRFSRLEPLPGCRFLHAVGETRPSAEGSDSVREDAPAYMPLRVAVSFGPEHAPLEPRQVQRAWEEARQLNPKPQLLLFAAFQFDPEAAKDIDEMKPELAGMQFLKVQMNADLLTEDLKKKRTSNESFWLIGQPDVEVLSFEFLVLSEGERKIAEYGTFKKLSGLDRLAEVHRLSWQDLFLYALLSQGRDVWAYLANQEGWDFHTGQYRRRAGAKQQGGVPAISWHSSGLVGGIRDFTHDLAEFGISDLPGCRSVIERLRGSREIVGGLETLAQRLNFPIAPSTKNWQLKTKNLYCVAVHGFDYYNTKTGQLESGGKDKIALWMLDTDYDGRALYPRQVFFPLADNDEAWAKLARNLKAEIDPERIRAYWGTVSLPFEPGEYKRIAVKIVDDRGIESMKVMEVE